jgi:hypothetical protein
MRTLTTIIRTLEEIAALLRELVARERARDEAAKLGHQRADQE